MALLSCPCTYFGKGSNYILPDDPETIREFEAKWKEWETEHPDDPTGEKALAEYLAANPHTNLDAKTGHVPPPRQATQKAATPASFQKKEELEPTNFEIENETRKLRLELPDEVIEKLKRYARYCRRRPRDIIIGWVEKYCQL